MVTVLEPEVMVTSLVTVNVFLPPTVSTESPVMRMLSLPPTDSA